MKRGSISTPETGAIRPEHRDLVHSREGSGLVRNVPSARRAAPPRPVSDVSEQFCEENDGVLAPEAHLRRMGMAHSLTHPYLSCVYVCELGCLSRWLLYNQR